jgi:hypothetical protein
VQAFPSSQTAAMFVWTQPTAGAHESFVHTLLSLQLNVPAPGWQLPPLHVSPTVQAFPSLHAAVLFAWTHPAAGEHVSFVHALLSLQSGAPVPGWQLPPPHVSPTVQAFPSSHAAVLFAWTHPTAASHESVVQALLSSQSGAPAPGWQLPPAHASPTVQALPSSHVAALLT